MQKKGEKFAVEELIPLRPGTKDNGGPALALAGWRLGKPINPPLPMEYVAKGKARVVSQANGWPDEENKTNQSWASFIDILKSKRSDIAAVQQTVLEKNAIDLGTHYTDLLHDHQTYFKPVYYSAQWLAAAALADVKSGHLSEACEKIRAGDALARKWANERVIRVQAAGVRTIVMLNYRIIWEILQANNITETQLAVLQTTVQETWLLNNLPDAYAMERLQMSAAFTDPNEDDEMIKFFNQDNRDLFPSNSANNDHYLINYAEDKANSLYGRLHTQGTRLYYVYWRSTWLRQAELRLLQYRQLPIDITRSMGQLKSFKDAQQGLESQKRKLEPHGYYDGLRLTPLLLAFNYAEPVIFHAAVAETQREMCLAAIALKRYQLKHGQYPSNLTFLMPEFLKSVPVSYMDGKPLHYRLNENGTCQLYSVGKDGLDHGGDSSSRVAKGAYSFKDGQDLVWPQPAAQKEIEEFEMKSRQ